MMAFSPDSISQPLVSDLGVKSVNCQTHGLFESNGKRLLIGKGRELWTVCPSCVKDRTIAEERAKAEQMAAARQQKLESMLRQTAVPARFIGRSLDNWSVTNDGQAHALKVCREYITNFERHHASGTSLVFSGAAGTGKSHLAAAILQAILPRHVGVYLTFMGMIRLIRETWHPESTRRESEVIAELGSLPLLVLDEIGVQYGTEAEHTLLFEVMDRRYRDQKPSILLTNQNKDGFRKFVGDRVFDRMTECARWVSFDWSSYRPKARTETY